MNRKSFTLLELLITVIIIGILATLGTVSFTGVKEETLDKEAKANLRLILAAQRIYRMEVSGYYPYSPSTESVIDNINTDLRLLLSTAANPSWNYSTKSTGGPPSTSCCAQATRNGGDSRNFRMLNTDVAPSAGACP